MSVILNLTRPKYIRISVVADLTYPNYTKVLVIPNLTHPNYKYASQGYLHNHQLPLSYPNGLTSLVLSHLIKKSS